MYNNDRPCCGWRRIRVARINAAAAAAAAFRYLDNDVPRRKCRRVPRSIANPTLDDNCADMLVEASFLCPTVSHTDDRRIDGWVD